MSGSHTHIAATQRPIAKSDWIVPVPMRRGVDCLASTRSNRTRSSGTAAAPILGDPS